jgi:hypothetical protein
MRAKLIVLWTWIKDHTWLAIFAVLALAAFFSLGHFQEIAYGLFRALIAVIFISVILYIWFRDTIQSYLVSGTFVTDFHALEAKHKVAVTVTMVIAVLWLVVECLVHP